MSELHFVLAAKNFYESPSVEDATTELDCENLVIIYECNTLGYVFNTTWDPDPWVVDCKVSECDYTGLDNVGCVASKAISLLLSRLHGALPMIFNRLVNLGNLGSNKEKYTTCIRIFSISAA